MRVGETVFAIGNPHDLGWSHTQGVISQFRNRDYDDRRVRIIQTQAAINQGNSGGGLYDKDGYCLGINTWTADKRISEGIGFAIAMDTLSDLAPPPLAGATENTAGAATPRPTAAARDRPGGRHRSRRPRRRRRRHDIESSAARGLVASRHRQPSRRLATGRGRRIAPTMSTVRLRRLQADYEKMRDYVNRHPRLQLIQADGAPPERYQLEYRIRSLRQTDDDLAMVKSHMVEITLPLSYPRMAPQCRMLTPIFHPNIAPHAICIGDHWSPGEPLVVDRGADRRDDRLSELQHQEPAQRRGGAVGRPARRRVAAGPGEHDARRSRGVGRGGGRRGEARAGRVAEAARRPASRRAAADAGRSRLRRRPPPRPSRRRHRAAPEQPSAGSPARIAARSPAGGPRSPASSCVARAARLCSDAHYKTRHAPGSTDSRRCRRNGRPDRSGRPRAGRVNLVDAPAGRRTTTWHGHPARPVNVPESHGLEARPRRGPIGSIRRHREVLAVCFVVRCWPSRWSRCRAAGSPSAGYRDYPLPRAVLRGACWGSVPRVRVDPVDHPPGRGRLAGVVAEPPAGRTDGGRADLPGPLPAAGPAAARDPLIPPRWLAALGTALIVLLIVNWLADVVTGRLASV